MQTANEYFRDALLRHQIHLLRYSGFMRNKMNALLNLTEPALVAKIKQKLDKNAGMKTPADVERYYALLAAIRAIRGEAWDEARVFLAAQAIDLGTQEAAFVAAAVATSLPVVVETVLPTASQIRHIALSRPFEGMLLKDWASKMEEDDIRRIGAQIQLGMVFGEDSASIARRVVGTTIFHGEDGVTQTTRRQVQAITRTAVQHIANNVRAEFVQSNADLFTEEVLIATLDGRTTPLCRALDHKRFPVGKGPLPPLHFSCRSIRVAVFDQDFVGERPAKPVTEEMLVREYKRGAGLAPTGRNLRRNLPRGHKGKYDTFSRKRIREVTGPIPAETSYDKWLRTQSQEFQDDVLGKTKAKLFRAGMTLDKFINRQGDEINLAQLAKLDADAFRAAGLDPAKY